MFNVLVYKLLNESNLKKKFESSEQFIRWTLNMYSLLILTISVLFIAVPLYECDNSTQTNVFHNSTTVPPEITTGHNVTTPSGPQLSVDLCKKDGYFRNPHDCTLYYRCFTEDGKFHIYDYRKQPCTNGLVFDETKEVCMSPENTQPCHNIPFLGLRIFFFHDSFLSEFSNFSE